jgi:ubiquinone/menaquinone biosynthesis C-methylase UbiE
MELFLDTFSDLKTIVNNIVTTVSNVKSAEANKYTAHINRSVAMIQYIYYVSVVRRFVKNKSAIIIDWGGQYGHVSKLLSQYYPNTECYLANKDEYYATFWHDKLNIKNVKFGNYKGIDYHDNSADVLISSGVLEHVREYGLTEQESLSEIYRVLKPGGKFFLWNFPCKFGSIEMLYRLFNRTIHQYTYTKQETMELLKNAGFEIEFYDHHEFFNTKTRNVISKIIGVQYAWMLDYYFSKIPLINLIAQHMTIVAIKPL